MSLLDHPDTQEAIEWDLRHYLGVRLGDFYRDGLTIRELRVFIKGLPPDSNLIRFLRNYNRDKIEPTPIEDMPADYWGPVEHGLADVCDKLEMLLWIQLDHSKSKEPRFTPRPGMPRTPKGSGGWLGGLGIG